MSGIAWARLPGERGLPGPPENENPIAGPPEKPYTVSPEDLGSARPAPVERERRGIRALPEVSTRRLPAGRGYFNYPRFAVWR